MRRQDARDKPVRETRLHKAQRIERLRRRDGDSCWLCKKSLDFTQKDGMYIHITLDHVLPKSKGGRRIDRNLKLAHRECNNLRGNADIVDTIHLIRRLVQNHE